MIPCRSCDSTRAGRVSEKAHEMIRNIQDRTFLFLLCPREGSRWPIEIAEAQWPQRESGEGTHEPGVRPLCTPRRDLLLLSPAFVASPHKAT